MPSEEFLNEYENPHQEKEVWEAGWNKEFTICPNCGSERRMADEIVKEQIRSGRARIDLKAWLFDRQALIMDSTKPVLSAPLIHAFFDACLDCGTVYCIGANTKLGVVQVGKKVPTDFS